MLEPRATYRVQLHRDFRFSHATEIVPYLAELGFSHLYTSPITAARPGSTHGYDVIDHNRLNPELGGDADFDALVETLQRHGMGLIVDVVPNHVGIGPDNPAWVDVLEWGQRSPCASMFDIDWHSSRRNLEGKVLLPVLGDHFGAVLERGEFSLKLDRAAGTISAWYYDNRLPLSPLHYDRLLEPALAALKDEPARRLANLVRDFEALRAHTGSDQALRDSAAGLKTQLVELAQDDSAAGAIDTALAAVKGDALGHLLDEQAYRPAFWRVSSDEINYRRFFDINDLAGLRVELPEVFERIHHKVFELVDAGKVDGLRIDHIDGLFDPREYAQRLQQRLGKDGQPFYVVLEKILAHHEDLPEDWPVAGTTGYDTLNLVQGLFVDAEAERAFSALYKRYTKRGEAFDDILYECKKRIVQVNLASEVGVLSNAVQTLSASQWRSRDFTYAAIRKALEELIARFPVYRTYIDREGYLSAADRRYISWAVGLAKKHAGPIDTSVFDFLESLLKGEIGGEGSPYPREQAMQAAMRFQQLSGPAMAKGLEDTSFYRYFRLIAHNEVGGDPRRWSLTPAAFHRANELRLKKRPLDMLGASTHDTKRGEDARLRIACLTGMPKQWAAQLALWTRANRRLLSEVDGAPAPEPNHLYYFYQTLIGAWPLQLQPDDSEGLAALAERVDAAMLKALREGKERSSWTHPNAAYEAATSRFVRGALDASGPNPFIGQFHAFVQRVAQLGAFSSVSQTLLRMTMPGVPDVYRGAELWELSMVDPDNRRPLDYEHYRSMLAALDGADPAELVEHWHDGRIKLHVIRTALKLRRERPLLFSAGSYEPVDASGLRASNLLAYRRRHGSDEIVVVAPRLWPQLLAVNSSIGAWDDTRLPIPSGRWIDQLSGQSIESDGKNGLSVAQLLASFPAALLVRG